MTETPGEVTQEVAQEGWPATTAAADCWSVCSAR